MGALEGLVTSILPVLALVLLWRQLVGRRLPRTDKSVAIVVLGDIGRSPRMLYHAESFVSHGFTTYIFAYKGSTPPKDLLESPLVQFLYLPTPLAFVSGLPKPLFLLLAPFKVVAAAFSLFWCLVWKMEVTPAFLLVQNPPAIPTLPIVKVASALLGCQVLIDWHNTGYSMLSLRLGPAHPVVAIAKIEAFWGQDAYAHLCVSEAMKQALTRDLKLRGQIAVFHDRPPSHFRRQTADERMELFARLPVFAEPGLASFIPLPSVLRSPTTFRSPSRAALVVSATSWTADEDFSILLAALELYERAARASQSQPEARRLPRLLVVVTGKGAGKAGFESAVANLERGPDAWQWVRARTAWLAIEDYPKLLGSADLGVSMHASTSGADLPMKVVDMFGCGLPVCSLDFACISELVQDGTNGRIFRTSEDLADQLATLLRDPSTTGSLREGISKARYGAGLETWGTWEANWDSIVLPLLTPGAPTGR